MISISGVGVSGGRSGGSGNGGISSGGGYSSGQGVMIGRAGERFNEKSKKVVIDSLGRKKYR
jgi:hypothetical protein